MYKPITQMIVALAVARKGYGGLRTWFGALADLGEGTPEVAIARHMGCAVPWPPGGPEDGWLQRRSREEAIDTLVFLATGSMVHPGATQAEPALTSAIILGVDGLGGDAHYFSNGDWHKRDGGGSGWRGLTEATFDTGIIGHNRQVGFMIWGDEED